VPSLLSLLLMVIIASLVPAVDGLKVTLSVVVDPPATVFEATETVKSLGLLDVTDEMVRFKLPVFSMTKLLVKLPVLISCEPKSVNLAVLITEVPVEIVVPLPRMFISLSAGFPDTLKV